MKFLVPREGIWEVSRFRGKMLSLVLATWHLGDFQEGLRNAVERLKLRKKGSGLEKQSGWPSAYGTVVSNLGSLYPGNYMESFVCMHISVLFFLGCIMVSNFKRVRGLVFWSTTHL